MQYRRPQLRVKVSNLKKPLNFSKKFELVLPQQAVALHAAEASLVENFSRSFDTFQRVYPRSADFA